MTLKECQSVVAQKHGLGKSLVTGHKASYFNEATELFTQHLAKSIFKESREFIVSALRQEAVEVYKVRAAFVEAGIVLIEEPPSF